LIVPHRAFPAGDHLEQRRLAGAVRADDADDAARRQLEGQVFDQQLVAEGLVQVRPRSRLVAEARARGMMICAVVRSGLLALGLGGHFLHRR
jgi:hypothetical protein